MAVKSRTSPAEITIPDPNIRDNTEFLTSGSCVQPFQYITFAVAKRTVRYKPGDLGRSCRAAPTTR